MYTNFKGNKVYFSTGGLNLVKDNETLCFIYEKLSNIEFNCSENTKDKFQLAGLIGIFIIARNMIIKNN